MVIEVTCSKGTYIRTLATQIGEALGLPAHLGQLRRTRVGPHSVEGAVDPESCGPKDLMSMGEGLRHLPSLTLSEKDAVDVAHGRPLTFEQVRREAAGLRFETDAPLVLRDLSDRVVAVALAEANSVDWNRRPGQDRALRYACVLSA